MKLMNWERKQLSLLRDKLGTSRSGLEGKVVDVTTQLKGLKEFPSCLLRSAFIGSHQGGASTPSNSHTSGCMDHTASDRPSHPALRAASSSAARAPTQTHTQDSGPRSQ